MSWASVLEDGTRAQAVQTSELPIVQPYLALMPDAHLGKGATVGSVIPTEAAIIPAAVGVDIGCGMMAVRTQYTAEQLPASRPAVHAAISAAVPLSAGRYNRHIRPSAATRIEELEGLDGIEQAEAIAPNWRQQLGSLGSGNHFYVLSGH